MKQNKKLTTAKAISLLKKIHRSGTNDRINTLYQYTKGGWITQKTFREVIRYFTNETSEFFNL